MSAPTGGIASTVVCMHNTPQIFTKISLGNTTLLLLTMTGVMLRTVAVG